MEKQARVQQEETPCRNNVACEIQDDAMDEMIEALVVNVLSDDANPKEGRAHDAKEKFIRDTCKEQLYVGVGVSKLRAFLSMLNLQTTFGWLDASVFALFQLMQKLLPEGNCLPNSQGEAKKILAAMGLDYIAIHACPNDYVLYQVDFSNIQTCHKCKVNCYRQDLQGTNVPCKVLRYFPLIPRLRHMWVGAR